MSTILHRFTPPTCTLEIKGTKSPLSRWTERDLLNKFQFQLSFDDPRLPSEKQITIFGNKAELEQLHKAVDNYVQHHLHASLSSKSKVNNSTANTPYLQPDGLVNHQLFLANLTNDATENKVRLSTVQLFDLVTALEGYSTEIAALPALKPTRNNKIIPLWGSIAAVTVAAIGFGAITLNSPPSNVATSTRENSPEAIPELDEVIPPKLPQTTKTPPQTKPSESISSRQRLPPPPAVDTPKPKPNIPDPADYPLSEIGKQSGLSNQKPKKQIESAISIPPKEENKQNQAEEESQSATIVLEPNLDRTQAETDNIALGDQQSQDSTLSSQDSSFAVNRASKQSKPNQLQEIKNYFQGKWQPPADLKQSLEYRLYINGDGSIDKVISLGKAAKLYLSQTNIPVRGETFISPLKEQKLRVRLLLNPNGEVKVFKE